MKYHILISEDDHIITKRWKNALEREGYVVDVANDGRTALDLWSEKPYDLIILDLLTPKVKGGEILKRVNEKQPWTPCIIISGEGTPEDKVDAVKQHAFDYFEKPVKIDKILDAIRSALDQRDLVVKGLEKLVAESEAPEQPFFKVGNHVFSPKELYDEVRMATDGGNAYRAYMEARLLKEASRPLPDKRFRDYGLME